MVYSARDDSRAPMSIDPVRWLRSWQYAWRVAPESLVQPILSGWTLNINSNNSSAPQTEADVLAKHSYGRQLGRIADVVELLIKERPKNAAKDPSVGEFLSMKRDIDDTKAATASERLRRITMDLRLLRMADKALYDQLRTDLLKALEGE
jgi:hypothetical protein